MDVSVIIVNYNTVNLLCNCINSIYDKTKGVDYEIIVVDNHSTDGSIEILKRKYPQVRLIENLKNLGFGKSNNLGVSISKGRYLLLLNSDTIFCNNAIKRFIDFYESHLDMNLGVIGGWLLNERGEVIHSAGEFMTMMSMIKKYCYIFCSKYLKIIQYKKQSNIKSQLFVQADYVTGADLFMETTLFKEIGGFDEDFFMYAEDMYLQKQIAKTGRKNYLIKGPQIIHLEGRSCKINWKKRLLIDKSMFVYFRKEYAAWKVELFKKFYIFLSVFAMKYRNASKEELMCFQEESRKW
jgi:GT2 family glycosyltransferase